MPFSPAGLKNELKTDPLSMGYLPYIQSADDAGLAALINSTTSPGATIVLRNDISPIEIIKSINSDDFKVLTADQISKINLILSIGNIDATDPNLQNIFLGIFIGMTNTVNKLLITATRQGSRAEVLFGTGVIVTSDEVGAAR